MSRRVALVLGVIGVTAAHARPDRAPGRSTGTGPPFSRAPFEAVALGDSVFLVPGDTGRGSEGRPNAGFMITHDGVAVIEALGSPWQAKQLLATIRRVTPAPVRWLILTHHHPDHMMGAIVFRRLGAQVIAHPDRTMLARENGDDGLVADWDATVGLQELRGFRFADAPTIAVTRDTTMVLGEETVTLLHPAGAAHSPADLGVWLPRARVLFAGDLVVEDGVSMVVDGNSTVLRDALTRLEQLPAATVIPGHGRVPASPHAQLDLTERYLDSVRTALRGAAERGTPLTRVLRTMPPPDSGRPVSLASRRQRNAERVYLEMERAYMELDRGSPARGARLISTDSLAALIARGGAVTIVDVRTDQGLYLRSHLPGAAYINFETLHAMANGVPNLLLPGPSYVSLFTGLGIRPGREVVIYSAGETRNSDATFLAWILDGFGWSPVAVLDGGFAKWELEARPTTRAYPAPSPGSFPTRPFTPARATLDDVRSAMADGARDPAHATLLVDARTPDQFSGQAGPQMRRGHIPGAINHPYETDLTDGLSHAFKSIDVLRDSYRAQGIAPDRRVIVYCNSGRESSHVYFVLHDLLGYPGVRVYDGSFTEYAAHPEMPVEALGEPEPQRGVAGQR